MLKYLKLQKLTVFEFNPPTQSLAWRVPGAVSSGVKRTEIVRVQCLHQETVEL
jgi:hypothetical protein